MLKLRTSHNFKLLIFLSALFLFWTVLVLGRLFYDAVLSKKSEKGAKAALSCEVNKRFEGFRAVNFRSGNSLEGYNSLEFKSCFAESDFLINPEGVLIAAHDDKLGGTCGKVSKSSLRKLRRCTLKNGKHVATLGDFLGRPLTEWFIDLKATQSSDDEKVFQAVKSAVKEINRLKREDGAVLMLYRTPSKVRRLIRDNRIRVGLKGYPSSKEGTKNIVRKAAKNKFELVCVKINYVDKEIIDFSARLGVWHLVWDLGKNEDLWSNLSKVGLGGVITRYPSLAQKAASPQNN